MWPDLTVDGSFGTGGAVCVMCLLSGQSVWVSLLAALAAGLLTGFVTGILHTFMGIPAILAGILTQLALYSVNLKIMGKANQSINVDKYDLLISLRWVKELALRNPIAVVTLATAAVIGVLYWFFGTELGCGIRATGSNPQMSRAQGINTNFNLVLGLAVSNGLVALSGALLAQYQGFADVSMGRGAIVIGLAAVIIGEVGFSKVFHNFGLKLLAVSIGAILYYIVIQAVLAMASTPTTSSCFPPAWSACSWRSLLERQVFPSPGQNPRPDRGQEQGRQPQCLKSRKSGKPSTPEPSTKSRPSGASV